MQINMYYESYNVIYYHTKNHFLVIRIVLQLFGLLYTVIATDTL